MNDIFQEGKRSWWIGRASNPVGDAMRCRVGSTPIPLRQRQAESGPVSEFNPTFPPELFYLIEHQVWARLEPGGTAQVGITSLGIELAGEIYMCRPKATGVLVEQGKSIAVVELAKSIVSVKSPVCGVVVQVNTALAQQPEMVHGDPYGAGWIARLQLTDFETDRVSLLQGDAVLPAMLHHAHLYRKDWNHE